MPSFDIVSELDHHELTNAIDQANREVTTRYDFKGSDSSFDYKDDIITLNSQSDFQIKQMLDILQSKMVKRGIDLKFLEPGTILESGKGARQEVKVREGIETDKAKKIVKMIKDKKMKVQAAIQGEKVRVTGKKRDDLQTVIQMLKEADLDIPLQFINFRD
ncbi:MAG TPA: YajQ family cyclic di-GMP-binding protein [Caldithrix abyssi]|uniref:Nucleotide-binding protein ENJ10_07280 n=1 Tax=Caldithrix abyssi TaxID=187145 RepID=A0A7V1LM00_CALAY|nr:YajQ family cyclic di-GMP-binding protein [Caldithrix abyssi]